jgi:hypothetical protein
MFASQAAGIATLASSPGYLAAAQHCGARWLNVPASKASGKGSENSGHRRTTANQHSTRGDDAPPLLIKSYASYSISDKTSYSLFLTNRE